MFIIWWMHNRPALYGPFNTIDEVKTMVSQTFAPFLAERLNAVGDHAVNVPGMYTLYLVASVGTGDAPVQS